MFTPFRLDLGAERLWQGEGVTRLTAKAFAVLRYLVEHAGQLVSKDELVTAVWAQLYVSEAALASCISEIRRALGDTAQAPQFLETVRGRGYRFLAPVTMATPSSGMSAAAHPRPAAVRHPGLMVGREAELTRLQQWWTQAQQGQRQIVFVMGEAGIGKTTLIDAFVAQVVSMETVWFGRGQCIEQYGGGEAYLPLLEALGQICRGPHGARFVEVLHHSAPSWLLQMPALLLDAEIDALQRRSGGMTQERMLRELAEAVEVLTAEQPLLLVLEDLHWSDASTLDWLAYVARRRPAARLLVLGTYRPVEAVVQAHPVRAVTQDLLLHGQGAELAVEYLFEGEVAAYLVQRFGMEAVPDVLARMLHQRTSGNPLFLVAVVDDLVQQGVLRQRATRWELAGELEATVGGVPESLRQLIDQQFAQLPSEDQILLEAASVVGREFAAAVVAAAVDVAVDVVEVRCAALARRGQFVRAGGTDEWPDGTVATRYRFLHDLYRQIVYKRVPMSRQVRWHRQMGARLEAGYGTQAREFAAELAKHFVRGRDAERAVQYLHIAGEQALQRSAHQEALRHLTQGLELLAMLPETPQRAQQELDLQIALGPVLIATRSQASPEVEQTYARARVLCTQVGETPQLFPTLQGLCEFYRNRGALQTARELGEQLVRLAQRTAVPTLRLEAHIALGTTLFHLGEYVTAWSYLEQGIALTHQTAQPSLAHRQGVAPGVRCLALAANTLWCLGFPAQAVQRSQEALALAHALTHPYSLAMAQHFAAFLAHRRRDAAAVQEQAEALLALATTQGFPLYVGYGTCYRGWALALQGQGEKGIAHIRQGLTALLATGLELSRPLWTVLLAEAAGHAGQVEEGLCLLGEALTMFAASGRGDMLTEAHRLQGELLLRSEAQKPDSGVVMSHAISHQPSAEAAEVCFHQALTIARRQQARSWELRAAMSLSHLWQQQGKHAAARHLLAEVYGWFTEGCDTPDLRQARALLDELRVC
jgi:DNA-binding winged helix-turn-helix (wHTH) protein/predicted ATPase